MAKMGKLTTSRKFLLNFMKKVRKKVTFSTTNHHNIMVGGERYIEDFFAISLLLYNDNQQSMTHVLLENVMSLIMD